MASSCASGIDAGAAALDGDRRVTVSDVQTAFVQVNRIVPADQQFDQRTVLSFLITEPYVVAAATSTGVGVSEDDARNIFVRSSATNPAAKGLTPAPVSIRLVRSVLALTRLGGGTFAEGQTPLPEAQGQAAVAQVVEQLRARDVMVNPRYGTFEPVFDPAAQKVFPVTADTDNWLVPPTQPPLQTPSQ
jgi:hypothetical protein